MSVIMFKTLYSISSLRKSAICSRLESRVPVSSPTRTMRIIIGANRPVCSSGPENPSPVTIRCLTDWSPFLKRMLPAAAMATSNV